MDTKGSNFTGLKLVAATIFAMAMLTTVSQAYTFEQQQMCAGDAMRLCAADIPDVGRITTCMERQRDALSDGCRAVFEVDTPQAATAAAPSEAPSPRVSKPVNLTARIKRS
jgi:hypothetical protein